MATSDKVQKLSGEAFHKLKSDHEQFLEAYEKPTQIYRFLKARHSLKPLFLHRNLSYMRMHRQASEAKQKRRRKLRVDELVEHTKETKPDLATEIKSDNHLKISFSGLEDGIDFNQLLADANEPKPTSPSKASRSHDCQLIEVEILLYSFNQPSAEALLRGDRNSFQCSCSSLGKRVIHYDVGSTGSQGKRIKACQPLMIPESSLTWKHRQGPGGTQMIVFRASQYLASTSSKSKKKRGRKNGLQERIVAECSESVSATRETCSGTAPQTSSSVGMDVDLQRTLLTDVMTGESVALPNSATSAHDQLCAEPSSKKSKSKPETKDACVMTDIRFGTDVINELAPIYQSQVSSLNSAKTSAPPLHNDISTHSRKSPKPSRCRSTSPYCSRQDKCTSPLIPKLALRNGMLNGYTTVNGYAAPNVAAIRQNVKRRKKAKQKLSLYTKSKKESSTSKPPQPVASTLPPRDGLVLLSKPKPSPLKKLGSGKQGTHSFLVSIPRKHFSGKSPPTTEPFYRSNGGSKNLRSPRRTEIQLLLDGDKPRGQRVSADQVPKFTAEDVSSWCTNSMEKATWLGSSTRKIIPVDHYNYPLSPKKTNGSILSTHSLSGDRKRSHSEDSTPSSPRPPPKLSRLSTSSDTSSTKLLPSPFSPSTDKPLVPSSEQAPSVPQSKEPSQSSAQSVEPAQSLPQSLEPGQSWVQSLEPGQSSTQALEPGQSSTQALEPRQSLLQPKEPVQNSVQAKEPSQNSVNAQDGPDDRRIQSDEVFCAELAVFDSRGDCLLRDGEYAVMMQHCLVEEARKPSDLLIFNPLTWSSVFAGTEKRSESVKKSRNVLLKFSLSWTDGPPQHQLCSNLDTALDLKKIRESYYLPSSPRTLAPPLPHETTPIEPSPPTTDSEPLPFDMDIDITATESSDSPPVSMETVIIPSLPRSMSREKVFFNFLYGNNSLQQTECQDDMRCPWCFIYCHNFYSFLKHMSLCHPRFQFTYSPSVQRAKVIDVHVNKLYDTSSSIERDPGERDSLSLVRRRQRPAKCFSCTCVLVDRGAEVEEDLSEFMNDGSWRRGYNTNRMYYHSNSCLPMLEEEIKVDSEGENTTMEWQKICCQKMLDDFTDVNKGEKRLMKLWNLFVMEHRLIAEKQVPAASLLFAKKYREKLIEERIDRNYLSHLISLYDFGLIPSTTIKQCMSAIYDSPES